MMASSSIEPDEQSKKHSISNTETDSNPQTEAASRSFEGHRQPPPPAMTSHPQYARQHCHHPHSMGYPPVVGLPPGHPPPPYTHNYGPYHNYGGAMPPAPHPHPHGGYYPNPAYLPPHGPPVHQSGMVVFGFIRGILAAIIILFIISAIFSIITYIIIRPQEPIFRLATFSVSDFNVSNAVLMASWEAKVVVENPNEKLRAYFDRIQSYVYYKEPGDYLAYSLERPISMDTKSNTTVTLRSSMINHEQPRRWVVDEIEKERKGGSVSFGLGIRLVGIFKTESSSTVLLEHLQVFCGDVKVVFAAGSTAGTLATGDKPRECSLYAS